MLRSLVGSEMCIRDRWKRNSRRGEHRGLALELGGLHGCDLRYLLLYFLLLLMLVHCARVVLYGHDWRLELSEQELARCVIEVVEGLIRGPFDIIRQLLPIARHRRLLLAPEAS